ncbi:hypothetical protein CERZMDRAFT_90725, partial [Cercospora zeae-maydis SCOH1-5]
ADDASRGVVRFSSPGEWLPSLAQRAVSANFAGTRDLEQVDSRSNKPHTASLLLPREVLRMRLRVDIGPASSVLLDP